MPGKIVQVLPNQSYIVSLPDGHEFRRNEHYITTQQQSAKPAVVPQSPHLSHEPRSYNLRSRKIQQSVK